METMIYHIELLLGGEGVESLEENPRTGRKVSKTSKNAEATIQNQ